MIEQLYRTPSLLRVRMRKFEIQFLFDHCRSESEFILFLNMALRYASSKVRFGKPASMDLTEYEYRTYIMGTQRESFLIGEIEKIGDQFIEELHLRPEQFPQNAPWDDLYIESFTTAGRDILFEIGASSMFKQEKRIRYRVPNGFVLVIEGEYGKNIANALFNRFLEKAYEIAILRQYERLGLGTNFVKLFEEMTEMVLDYQFTDVVLEDVYQKGIAQAGNVLFELSDKIAEENGFDTMSIEEDLLRYQSQIVTIDHQSNTYDVLVEIGDEYEREYYREIHPTIFSLPENT